MTSPRPRRYGDARDVRIAFRVTEAMKRDLEYWAARNGINISAAMELALSDWVAKQKYLEAKESNDNDRTE